MTRVVQDAVELFTVPMANADPDSPRTSVVEDIEAWMYEERGSGGRRVEAGSVRYTVLAVLVAFHLLICGKRPVSQAEAMRVLLYEMTNEQRELVGMTSDLSDTRMAAVIAALDVDGATASVRKEHTREYARFAKFVSAMCAPFDPSLFAKRDTLTAPEKAIAREEVGSARTRRSKPPEGPDENQILGRRRHRVKMTNAMRNAIVDDPTHPDRRIGEETRERNHERLHALMNKVVAKSGLDAPRDGYVGDIASDETLLITLPSRYGHGTAADKLISADPDAMYWKGKYPDKPMDEDPRGFGYGITYAVRMGRPYARSIAEIVVGIHIGRPTGGTTAPVRAALVHAERHGLTAQSRSRALVVDMGFNPKDDWPSMLHEQAYRPCVDMPSHWITDLSIKDTDANGQPAIGPRIISGAIRCPGAHGLPKSAALTPHNEQAGPESRKQILDRHRKTLLLDALAMPVKQGLRPVKTAKRGRPRRGETCSDWAITVQCPAALGLVNCNLVMRSDGLRYPNIPDVPSPPNVSSVDLLPRACRQDHVTYRLDNTTAKKLQPFTHGSFLWADMYRSLRSANERFHSQWKSRASGGVSTQWLEVRGIAKIGLLAAISTAITNRNLIADYNTKQIGDDGKAQFGTRETLRRHRQRVIREHQA